MEEKKITLADGSQYEGPVDSLNLPNGQGRQVFDNGDEFDGFFIQGQKNGIGKLEKKG